MFPSLVNCSTIDWFLPWPEEALTSVAEFYLSKVEIEKELFKPITKICVKMQMTIIEESQRFLKELRKYYYVTPMSFIQLLNLFKDLLINKKKTLRSEIEKYTRGLKIIEQSEKIAFEMKTKINDVLTPEITTASKICNEKRKEANEKTIISAEKEKEVSIVELEAKEKKRLAEEKNKSAQENLSRIKIVKEKASEKANQIQSADILQIQTYKYDEVLNDYCKLFCILLLDKDIYPKPSKSDNPKEKTIKYDFFKHAKEKLFTNLLKR